jgi:hypothetical protein
MLGCNRKAFYKDNRTGYNWKLVIPLWTGRDEYGDAICSWYLSFMKVQNIVKQHTLFNITNTSLSLDSL